MAAGDYHARCRCGQLSVSCAGEPVRVSVCHCTDCQRRSGSAFAAQVRFPVDAVTITGEARIWDHVADSGNPVRSGFCPVCGSTLFYESAQPPDLIAIPYGAFGSADLPAPAFSVYEERRKPWVVITGESIEHIM